MPSKAVTIIQHPGDIPLLTVLNTWDEMDAFFALKDSAVFGFYEYSLQRFMVCPACGSFLHHPEIL